jgi:DNA-binding MarR family transcriptional regulator
MDVSTSTSTIGLSKAWAYHKQGIPKQPEPEPTPVPAPAFDLLLLVKRLQSNIALVAEGFGLTIMQLYTMHAIGEEHQTTMGKTAEAIRCDASNVTGIIDKLVAMGLVSREENPNDRRIKTLQLTTKGRDQLHKVLNAMAERLGYSRVTQEEIGEFRSILLKLTGGPQNCDAR